MKPAKRYRDNKVAEGSKRKTENAERSLRKAEGHARQKTREALKAGAEAVAAVAGAKAAKEVTPDVTPRRIEDEFKKITGLPR